MRCSSFRGYLYICHILLGSPSATRWKTPKNLKRKIAGSVVIMMDTVVTLSFVLWSRRQVLLRPGRWKRLLKFFSRLFLVDKTFIYENPYEGVWGVLGNSSYKPFYNDLSPLETISNLCFSHFSWKQSKQWTVVGYIYYIIYVTQYIHKQVWWNVFEIMGYAPLYLKSIKCF